jgi:hypothetical protein
MHYLNDGLWKVLCLHTSPCYDKPVQKRFGWFGHFPLLQNCVLTPESRLEMCEKMN